MTFNNTAQSDFMKLVAFPEDKKANLINYASNDNDMVLINNNNISVEGLYK